MSLVSNATLAPRNRRWILTGAILVAGVLISVVMMATADVQVPLPPAERAWRVSTLEVDPRSLTPMLAAYGSVQSSNIAKLRVSVDLPVAEVLVREGQLVSAGELLLRFEEDELRLALAEHTAVLRSSEANLSQVRNELTTATKMAAHHSELARISRDKLARYEALFTKRMIGADLLDQVREQASQREIALADHELKLANLPAMVTEHESFVARATAQRDRAKVDLAQAHVRAPFAGPVLSVHVAAGDRPQGNVLMEVADRAAVEVRAALSDRYLPALQAALQRGHAVLAYAQSDPQRRPFRLKRLAGDIKTGQGGVDGFFGPTSDDEMAGFAQAETRASGPDDPLTLGRTLDLQIVLPPEPNVVALPLQALYESDRIYRIEQSRLVPLQVVRVGDFVNARGQVEVLVRAPDLRPGMQVITTQLPQAMSGLLVEPVNGADSVARG